MADNEMPEELRRQWLHAADTGAVDDLQALLCAHPSLLNCCDRHQSLKASTALHLSAWRNHPHVAQFLLQAGANIEARDEAGMTPLQIDILRVCMEKMRPIPLLRARCIDVGSPVALAKYRRQLVRDRSSYEQIDTSTLEVFLKYKADVNSYTEVGEMALLLAMDDGLIKHVKLLLAHGADPFFTDKNGRMTLDIAAEHGYADLVELLMERYPRLLELAGERALRAAVCHDSRPVLELLYDRIVALKSDEEDQRRIGGTLFHTAIEYDARAATQFLIDHNVSVDFENEKGETPLHIACKSYESESLLQLLLDSEADSNLCSQTTGYSPYHIAVQHHCLRAIELLAAHGADINVFDRNSYTPLVFAVVNGYTTEIMETLMRHGAHFRFRGRQSIDAIPSRDAIAPILTNWVFNLAPLDVPSLLDTLVVAGCVEHERSRCVVTALLWSRHTQDALLFLFLSLFTSSSVAANKARPLIDEWLQRHHATPIVLKLLNDSLIR